MTFKLYTTSNCFSGLLETVSEDVQVKNGLFSVLLTFSQYNINGQAVYLAVDLPAQRLICAKLLPVPYALSLKPKARIDGSVSNDPTVFIQNTFSTGSAEYSDALYAIANGTTGSGVTGISTNASGFGVGAINSSGVALRAEGKIRSSVDSVIELSPHSLVISGDSDNVVVTPGGNSGAWYGAVGVTYIYRPPRWSSARSAMDPTSFISTKLTQLATAHR